MGFTAIVDIEYPSKLGPSLAYPARYDVVLQRPLKLRHDMQLSNWQLKVRQAPATLASQKARAAQRIAFAKPAAVALPPDSKAAPQAAKPAASAPKTKTS